jgi:hypothetical protein
MTPHRNGAPDLYPAGSRDAARNPARAGARAGGGPVRGTLVMPDGVPGASPAGGRELSRAVK